LPVIVCGATPIAVAGIAIPGGLAEAEYIKPLNSKLPLVQVKPDAVYTSNVAVGQVVIDAIAAGAIIAAMAKNARVSFIEILSSVEMLRPRITRERKLW